jgi:hypothetical protein
MRKSSYIVRQVGWWRTFGLLLLIIAINLGVYFVVSIVLGAAGDALPGILTAVLGLAPLLVFLTPFETCFLTNMYRASQVQAGLPDTFEPNPVALMGGTGLAFRQAVAQVKEAARELKAGTASQAPVGGAPPLASGGPARAQASGGGVAVVSPSASSFAAFCGKCGTPRNGEARFCRQCGNSLERSAPS